MATRSGSQGLNPGPVCAHSPFIGTRSRSQGINPGPDYIFPLPSPSVGGGLGAKLKMWVPCATNRQMFKACTATTTKSSKQNQLICQKSAYIGASWIVWPNFRWPSPRKVTPGWPTLCWLSPRKVSPGWPNLCWLSPRKVSPGWPDLCWFSPRKMTPGWSALRWLSPRKVTPAWPALHWFSPRKVTPDWPDLHWLSPRKVTPGSSRRQCRTRTTNSPHQAHACQAQGWAARQWRAAGCACCHPAPPGEGVRGRWGVALCPPPVTMCPLATPPGWAPSHHLTITTQHNHHTAQPHTAIAT